MRQGRLCWCRGRSIRLSASHSGLQGSDSRHGFCLLALHIALRGRGRSIVGAHSLLIAVRVRTIIRSLTRHGGGRCGAEKLVLRAEARCLSQLMSRSVSEHLKLWQGRRGKRLQPVARWRAAARLFPRAPEKLSRKRSSSRSLQAAASAVPPGNNCAVYGEVHSSISTK